MSATILDPVAPDHVDSPDAARMIDPIQADESPCGELVALWSLRALIDLGGYNEVHHDYRMDSVIGQVLRLMGAAVPSLPQGKDPTERWATVRPFLEKQYREREAAGATYEDPLASNLDILANVLKLDTVERDIVAFAALHEATEALEGAVNSLGDRPPRQAMVRRLARLLRYPRGRVVRALAFDSLLSRSGLIQEIYLGRDACWPRLVDGLADRLVDQVVSGDALLTNYYHVAPPPRLSLEDFGHVSQDVEIIRACIQTALEHREPGWNFLLWGPPGSGKTELVRALAASLGASLLEVSIVEADGTPRRPQSRMSAYQLAQAALERRGRNVILFDEIEDVFNDRKLQAGSWHDMDLTGKAWVNRLLETNPVPAIWAGNDIGWIDAAHRRRFAYGLELYSLAPGIRRRILENSVGDLPIDSSMLNAATEDRRLTPGHVESITRVLRASAKIGAEDSTHEFERILRRRVALGSDSSGAGIRKSTALPYDLTLVNADQDLEALTEGIKRHPEARLCLYGPPGTGKTAYARYLAKEIGRHVLEAPASKILSPFLGVTEKNIARLFDQARDEEAVLLIDEADSFLRDRAGAYRSWEVTQVNELLVQIENFDGVLVAATNLETVIDPAAQRRFDLSIKFDYLKPNAAVKIFLQLAKKLQLWELANSSEAKRKILMFAYLTPGDFTAATRANAFNSSQCLQTLVDSLHTANAKKAAKAPRSIGFVSG